MLRYGLINELGIGQNLGFARVYFDELNIVSDWLSLPTDGQNWTTYKLNTQVAVLMHPDGEQGQIIGSVWSDDKTPPSFASENTDGIEFPDGTKIYYDWNSHKLFVLSTNENTTIELTCKKLIVNGEIEATKEITAMTLTPATKVTLSQHIHAEIGVIPTPGT